VFDNLIGVDFQQYVSTRFADAMDGKQVFVVEVSPAPEAAFMTFQGKQDFFIRRGNVTVSLDPKAQHEFIRKRFRAD